MFPAERILDRFQIPYEPVNLSAHRTLDWLVECVAARGDEWKKGFLSGYDRYTVR